MSETLNVLGSVLITCSASPMTGFYRDGCCKTGAEDSGTHAVCSQMTEEFLTYTNSQGNDLSTPMPAYNFPGLKAGDFWCLCALRWQEAFLAGKAPKVYLKATHEKTLQYINLEDLKKHAIGTTY
tara:strand:+ start:154 stop:528 length:375 start_codon:yes stop_codon:yes gene_type:complete